MAMRFTRRQLVKLGAAAGAVALVAPRSFLQPPAALAFYQSPQGMLKFNQPLRGVGPGGIPVAAPDALPAPVTGALHYSIDINQYQDQLHSALGPTTLWGYNPVVP